MDTTALEILKDLYRNLNIVGKVIVMPIATIALVFLFLADNLIPLLLYKKEK